MFDAPGHEMFERYPAPTFVVDGDVRVVGVNRAGRELFGDGGGTPSSGRIGEAIACLHGQGPGGCGDQPVCDACVVRSSVRSALEDRPVHRARGLLRLCRRGREVEVGTLVTAWRVDRDGERDVVLVLEHPSDAQLEEDVARAQTALDAALARAAALARFPEENPDPVLRVAADLTLVYANAAAHAALRGLGLELSRTVPAALAEPVRRALAERARTRAELPCGGRVFSLSVVPVGSEVNVYADDVTERQRAHDELAAEKERLAVTLRSIGDGVIVTDEAGRVTMLNGIAEELTGWRGAEPVGASVEDVFHIVREGSRERTASPVDRALRAGTIAGLDEHTALIARDGTEHPIADSAAPIRDAAGRIVGAVLVFRDQTNERLAEQALRDSEARVRRKLESILSPEGDLRHFQLGDILATEPVQSLVNEFHRTSGIPVAVVDAGGKVLVGAGWQEICTRFHRLHPESCKHCVESDTQLSADVREGEFKLYRCKNNMWDAATPIVVDGHHVGNVFTGQFFFEGETPDRDLFRDQALRYGFDPAAYLAALDRVPRLARERVEAGMAFLRKLAGMLSRLSYSNVKLARSLTDRDALMKSLREKKEQLEEADRRKDEFLAMLSHELRNPLAPIRNSIYILQHAVPASEQAARAQRVIARQAEHLTRLVEDLLDVTRIARGKIELRPTRTDLRALVLDAGDDVRTLMEERGVLFDIDVPAGAVWADVDAARISQVVGNLLHNAAKFSGRGKRVTLSLGLAPGRAEIAVRDTGAGIDPTLLPTIFEAFVQGQHELARSQGGLGLGLALVKGITELHGGSVRAESAGTGKGALFAVALPLSAEATFADASLAAVRRAAEPRRVLIIDDNVDAARSLADIVELLGHTTDVAHDGPGGIARARDGAPDVVICDLGLPGMSGYEVARAIRAMGRTTQLVALSGYAQPEDVTKAREAGFDRHVAKPCDAARIAQILTGRSP